MNRFYESLFKARLHSGLALFAVLFVLLTFGSFVANAQTLTTSNSSYCAGDGVILSITGSVNLTVYTLYKGGVAVAPPAIVTGNGGKVDFTGTFTAGTYTSTNASGSQEIIENPIPQGSLSTSTPTFCATGPGMLTWTATIGTGPYTVIYKENGGPIITKTGVDSGTPFAVSTTPVTITTTYTLVSVVDVNCARSSGFTNGSATITVNALPQGSLTTTTPTLCGSGAGKLTWTATAGTGPFAIVYNDGTANRPASGVVSGTPFDVFTTPVTSTTTYTLVSVISSESCPRTTGFTDGTETITVNALPNIGLTVGGSGAICSGSSASISVSSTVAGVSYQLRNSANTSIGSPKVGPGSLFFETGTLTSPETFNVLATVIATSCSAQLTQTAAITILPLPADPSNPTGETPGCGNIILTRGNTPPTGVVYYWQTSATGENQSFSGATYTVTSSGTYYIRAYQTSTGCWSSGAGSLAVVVVPIPSITLGSTPSICTSGSAQTVNYTYTNAVGSPTHYAIDWDNTLTDVPITALPSSPIPVTAPGNIPNGTYNGTMTISNLTICSSTISIQLIVNTVPQAAIVTGSQNNCVGDVTNYTITNPQTGDYTWSICSQGEIISGGLGSTVAVRWNEEVLNNGGWIRASIRNSCGETPGTFYYLSVTNVPVSYNFTYTGPYIYPLDNATNAYYCHEGTGVTLTVSNHEDDVYYSLRRKSDLVVLQGPVINPGSGAFTFNNVTVKDYTDPAASSTVYEVIAQASTNSLCATILGEVTVYKFAAVVPSITGGNTPICYNTSGGTLTATATGGASPGTYSYLWYKNGSAIVPSVTTNTYDVGTITSTSTYNVYVTGGGCGPVGTATKTISVYPQFTAGTITSTGTYVCYGGTTTSTISSTTLASGGDGNITYKWTSFVSGGTELTVGINSSTHTIGSGTFTQTTTFKRYAKDGTCNTSFIPSGNNYVVNVYEDFTSGTITSTGEKVCYGALATGTITSTKDASGGKPSITYSWYSFKAPLDSTVISGATGKSYLPTGGGPNGTFTQTTTFKRYAKDNSMCQLEPRVSTGTWTVTVINEFKPGDIGTGNLIACGTTSVTTTTIPTTPNYASGGEGTISYQWRSSVDGGVTELVVGTNTSTYTISGTFSKTTTFKRYASDVTCKPGFTEVAAGIWTVTYSTGVNPNSIVVQDGVAAPPAHVAYQYSTHTYSVSPVASGNTYQWYVTGGTITSTSNITTIYVNWDQQVLSGTVTVTITGCNQENIGRYTTVTIKPNTLAGQVKYWNATESPMPSPFNTNWNGMTVPDYFYVTLLEGGGREASYIPVDTVMVQAELLEVAPNVFNDYLSYFKFDYNLDPDMDYKVEVWDGGYLNEGSTLYGYLGQNWTWNNWAGVNATDALFVQHMAAGTNITVAPYATNGIYWIDYIAGATASYGPFADKLANVNNSANGTTALDALLINRRVVGYMATFPSNKPNFEVVGKKVGVANFNNANTFAASVALAPNKPLPNIPFVKGTTQNYTWSTDPFEHKYESGSIGRIEPGEHYLNIYYSAVGDINASYVPDYGISKDAPVIELSYNDVLAVNVGEEVTIPVSIDRTTDLGALSLGLTYRNDLIEVVGTNYGEDFARFDNQSGALKISWSSLDGVSFNADDAVAYIKVRVLANIDAGTRLFELTNFTELADVNAEVIEGVNFKTLAISTDATQTIGSLNTTNSPNPFNSQTIISYTLPEAGAVNLVVYNKLGQVVKTFVNEYQTAGVHQVTVQSTDLFGPGVYVYRLEVKGESKDYSSTNSIILVR